MYRRRLAYIRRFRGRKGLQAEPPEINILDHLVWLLRYNSNRSILQGHGLARRPSEYRLQHLQRVRHVGRDTPWLAAAASAIGNASGARKTGARRGGRRK